VHITSAPVLTVSHLKGASISVKFIISLCEVVRPVLIIADAGSYR
jgi:hypothetical protein